MEDKVEEVGEDKNVVRLNFVGMRSYCIRKLFIIFVFEKDYFVKC